MDATTQITWSEDGYTDSRPLFTLTSRAEGYTVDQLFTNLVYVSHQEEKEEQAVISGFSGVTWLKHYL
jgi:hypothetical protein